MPTPEGLKVVEPISIAEKPPIDPTIETIFEEQTSVRDALQSELDVAGVSILTQGQVKKQAEKIGK